MRPGNLHLAMQQASQFFNFADECSHAEFLHETVKIADAYALSDELGIIYQSDNTFADLLQLEWPDWCGPQLPLPLGRLLSAQREHYLGARVAACIQRNGGVINIRIRERQLCA
jgi:hypothetical protein